MAKNKKYLAVLAGPTAVGKTDLTIDLARKFNSVIISADSRQFYREMSVGTAKPSPEQLSLVSHYFINSHSILEEFTVGQYEEEVLGLLKKLFISYDIVFLTGGSGLFIKAVCEGLDELPSTEAEVREELNNTYQQYGLPPLLNELHEKDPEFFAVVDRNNQRRVIRALEVIRSTGKKYSGLRSGEKKERDFECINMMLTRDRPELYQRIDVRVDRMIEEGLEQEAKLLLPFKDKPALQTVGYSEMFDYFEGKYPLEEAIRLIKRNTRRYAKRQLTWFRKEADFEWFHPDETIRVLSFLTTRMEQ